MKLLLNIFFLLLFLSCSFDNRTGIWNNENNPLNKNKNNKTFSEFKTLSSKNDSFNKIIPFDKNEAIFLSKAEINNSWNDIYYNKTNNPINFKYEDLNKLIFKSKKITKHEIGNYILLENNIIFVSTIKGDIIFYSIEQKRVVNKFNFYKKKFKNIPKKLNIIVQNNIIYISDNLGFLYAFDYLSDKLLWAQNYKIPFRSNLKLYENRLVAANQNNILYFFDKNSGEILKLIPTEETLVKNQFENNISISKNFSYFLNTYGSFYAIDNKSMQILWFINLNQSNDLNPSNLFSSNQIVNHKNNSIVTSNKFTYVLNNESGLVEFKYNFSSLFKPIVNNNNVYLISKDNLLICFNLRNGKILYSYNIDEMISNFLKIKKKKSELKNIVIAENKINIFLQNSHVLKLSPSGKMIDVIKLPSKLKTYPIFFQKNLIFIDKKNKISIVN